MWSRKRSKWLNKTLVNKLMKFISLNWIKSLLKNRSYKGFVTYSYAYACRNIFNTIKTSGHGSLEKIYLSLYSKGFERVTKGIICERWVGDWTELLHIDPHSSGHSSISFTFSWAAQPGAWGTSLCQDMVLIPASSLQVIWISWPF